MASSKTMDSTNWNSMSVANPKLAPLTDFSFLVEAAPHAQSIPLFETLAEKPTK